MSSYHRLVDITNCLYDEVCRNHEPEVFALARRQMDSARAQFGRPSPEPRDGDSDDCDHDLSLGRDGKASHGSHAQ
jgi:hypothetical protein